MLLISHQELVAIQLTWYRDGIFNLKVADIYNQINEQQIVISDKYTEKFRREEQLLRGVCKERPDDFDFIQECLLLQRNKSLMVRKRGLKDELERHLERYIAKQRIRDAVHE